jgi:SAM-dependent methyltransferase
VLHAGVGTSTLQVDMALDGYASVLSVDYSSVCITRLEAAREAYAGPQAARLRAALTYEVADMRNLGRHADGAFGGGAIEKGALDALACGDTADADLEAAVRELWRVLAPGAALVSVTWAKPAARLPVLLGAAAWASACVYEVGQAGAVAGPFSVNDVGSYSSGGSSSNGSGGIADGDPLASLPTLAYSHFAYVCVK